MSKPQTLDIHFLQTCTPEGDSDNYKEMLVISYDKNCPTAGFTLNKNGKQVVGFCLNSIALDALQTICSEFQQKIEDYKNASDRAAEEARKNDSDCVRRQQQREIDGLEQDYYRSR